LIVVVHLKTFDVALTEIKAGLGHLVELNDLWPGGGLRHCPLGGRHGSVSMLNGSQAVRALANAIVGRLGFNQRFRWLNRAIEGGSAILCLPLLGLVSYTGVGSVWPDHFLADVRR